MKGMENWGVMLEKGIITIIILFYIFPFNTLLIMILLLLNFFRMWELVFPV